MVRIGAAPRGRPKVYPSLIRPVISQQKRQHQILTDVVRDIHRDRRTGVFAQYCAAACGAVESRHGA